MKPLKTISDSELEVMKVLWERSPRSANAIIDRLERSDWSGATIRTLIGRLVKKGALRCDKSRREHSYEPKVSEADYARRARRSFIRRVYDGAVHSMIAQIIEDEELTHREIDELQRLLDRKRKGQ